jgi:SOS response regulatory protein OraA/RecX
MDEVLGALDDTALISAALARRLRGRETIKDDAEFARLYRYLLGQGFEADQVMKILVARSARPGRSQG